VTPLHGPGLRPSDPVPSRLDLGLSRPDESYPNIVLIDAARSQVYRPLTLKGSDSRCLCTRLSRNSLRIGYTSLFQIAFPHCRTTSRLKLAGGGALECLCTDLRMGASSLRQKGAQMSVVTTLPPLLSGISKVDIVLPGLTTLAEVAVTPAPDSTFRSGGPAVREVRFWTYRPYQQHPGWVPRDWPTPLPRSDQLRDFHATVDTIVR
jgi:hypothetical protein